MIRRQNRQRRDYLYRRAVTLQQASTASKRAALKKSLATGKPLAAPLAADASLRQDFAHDEPRAERDAAAELALDDEYAALSGITDPRVLVTTSRAPSSRLGTFAKEIRLLLPTAIRLNRGGLVLAELVASAAAAGLSDVLVLHEHRGTPAALTLSHLPHGPTARFSLHNVLLRADVPGAPRGSVSESYPHLVFEGFRTALGRRVVAMLKHLFPPREGLGAGGGKKAVGNRVVTFRNDADTIEVRHHVFVQTGRESVELAEVGPRMSMRLFEIRAGTLESADGDVEWRLAQYTRTSKKKDYL